MYHHLDDRDVRECLKEVRHVLATLVAGTTKGISDEERDIAILGLHKKQLELKINPPTRQEAQEYLLENLEGRKNALEVRKSELKVLIASVSTDVKQIETEVAFLDALASAIGSQP